MTTAAAAAAPAMATAMATVPQVPALRIDWTRCDGHGLCAALLPDSITLDEWGYPVISPNSGRAGPDHADEAAVRRAVSACPSLALRFASR